MSNNIYITAENVNTLMLTYERIELERASSASGSFANITDILLVEDQVSYTYEDTGGATSSWYRYRFRHDTGPVNGPYSNPFQLVGATRLQIRQLAIKTYHAGAVLTAAATSDADTLKSTDYRISSTAYNTRRGKGNWIYMTSGTRAGESSLITSPNPAVSPATFEINPALTGAPATSDEFEWHWLVSAEDWNDAINAGLKRIWILDRVPLVMAGTRETSLAHLPWLKNRRNITGLFYYPNGGDVEHPWSINTQWWGTRQEAGYITLITSRTPSEGDVLYLEALRRGAELFTDSSVIPYDLDPDYIAALAYDEVLKNLVNPAMNAAASSDRANWTQALRLHRAGPLRRMRKDNTPHPRWQEQQSGTQPAYSGFYRSR